MPSSTSSSEEDPGFLAQRRDAVLAQPPTVAWPPVWLGALVLLVVLGIGWEGLCRHFGFVPSVADTDKTFVLAMDRVKPDSIVIAGTSRSQADFDLDTFEKAWDGQRPVQLSIFGSRPVDVLEALAADPDYHGIVLVGVVERILFNANSIHQTLPGFYLDAWRAGRTNPAIWIEARLFVEAEKRLASHDPMLEFKWMFGALRQGRFPEQKKFVMTEERQIKYHWKGRGSRIAALMRLTWDSRNSKTIGNAERDVLIHRMEKAIRTLEARGGKVILLKLPSFGECRAWEEREFPRVRFWDRLVADTSAPGIHFADDPRLGVGGPGDCSHLDARDAPATTKAWVAEIRARLGEDGS